MNEIRKLTLDDLDEVFALDQFAFQFELTESALAERRERVTPANMIGHFVDDRLAAKMTILPLQTLINGAAFLMGGIASVATWPEYRRQGMVAKLLRQALSDMRENAQAISFLHPFSFAFYRKYGWETYVEYKKYTIEVAGLPAVQKTAGFVKRDQNWQTLNEVYNTYAIAFNGMLMRDEEWWQKRIFTSKKGQSAVCYNAAGQACGYLLYDIKNHEMTIHEMVFLDEQARGTLWAFIRNHDSMMSQVILKAPSND
ncbi:MAG: family N-acetyltransferase, partial [Bacilli bacterium]|nr:family N-acetyltransferase [Bacilli bacterium]